MKDPIQALLATRKAIDEALKQLLAGGLTCSEANAVARKGGAQARRIVKRMKRVGKAGGQS